MTYDDADSQYTVSGCHLETNIGQRLHIGAVLLDIDHVNDRGHFAGRSGDERRACVQRCLAAVGAVVERLYVGTLWHVLMAQIDLGHLDRPVAQLALVGVPKHVRSSSLYKASCPAAQT